MRIIWRRYATVQIKTIMIRYQFFLSEEAEIDFQQYIDYIICNCKAPFAALRYFEDLFNVLRTLGYMPERYAIQKVFHSCVLGRISVA